MRPLGVRSVAVAVAVAVAAACSSDAAAPTSTPVSTRASADAPSTAPTRLPDGTTTSAPTTGPPPAPTACDAPPGSWPGPLADRLDSWLDDPRLAPHQVGVSIWVDGWGEWASPGADVELLPASNQKLATAIAVLSTLDPDTRLRTTVGRTGEVRDGTLHGDLVLTGGGDATVTLEGDHSIGALARAVSGTPISAVTGGIIVDASRHEPATAAPGWLSWQQPQFVGYLSALMADDNRWIQQTEAARPASAVGSAFRDELDQAGVRVAGAVTEGTAQAAVEVASMESAPLGHLVATMLTESDNELAESLVRELGRARDGDGSHGSGTAAVHEALDRLCTGIGGVDADGSGLSRDDRRSARDWRRLLQGATGQSWGAGLRDGLPIAATSGTLEHRLPGLAGNLRAKTGQTIPARSLSGYATTIGGRGVVFSIVVNGEGPIDAERAIDSMITDVVLWEG